MGILLRWIIRKTVDIVWRRSSLLYSFITSINDTSKQTQREYNCKRAEGSILWRIFPFSLSKQPKFNLQSLQTHIFNRYRRRQSVIRISWGHFSFSRGIARALACSVVLSFVRSFHRSFVTFFLPFFVRMLESPDNGLSIIFKCQTCLTYSSRYAAMHS